MEAKLGKGSGKKSTLNGKNDESGSSEESSSEDEDEDENGELATEALDTEIQATLNAIRNKDPRVYDKQVTFYSDVGEQDAENSNKKKEKPMFLRDYHRQNLLNGIDPTEEESEEPKSKTFAEEQEDLKNNVVREMHDAADEGDDQDNDEEEDDFLVRKPTTESSSAPAKPKADAKLDIENADKDPETFLSNFMSSRAWVLKDRNELHPFESDDEEEQDRAEAFEEAYNFRFEDPNKMNETLVTHARDASNKYSVRREEKSSRKKHREAERVRKEEGKKERESEKNRLRKLKVDELHDKVRQIKEVSGLRASNLTDEDWAHFLDDAFDDQKWESEMQKRFSNEYYEGEEATESGNEEEGEGKRKRPKKPKWDDDIDITDIVPEFEEEQKKPQFGLSDIESDGEEEESNKNKKSKAQEKREQKRDARKEKLRIEEAVDRNLDLDIHLLPGASKKNKNQFRYRETSPQSFGLTARDILMAEDSQLNQFAGLKKLASFRDPEKKRGDQKKLGKKARLRKWRQDTFGGEEAPELSLGGKVSTGQGQEQEQRNGDGADSSKVDVREGVPKQKKRKRSKKN